MKASTDPRHQARRLALQTLFEWSFLSKDLKEILKSLIKVNLSEKESGFPKSTGEEKQLALIIDQTLVENLTQGVIDNLNEIDEVVQKCAPEWPINQIAKIDLTILRLAIFELLHEKQTSHKVVIDEAVELGKEFGSDQSPKFVNGVLGSVVKLIGEADQ